MSESTFEQETPGDRLAAAVQKLLGVKAITWGTGGNWRAMHVVALKDFTLASTVEPYLLDLNSTVYIDKRSYPGEIYSLHSGKTVPAANVELRRESEEVLLEEKPPGASSRSKETFYVGTVIEAYQHQVPSPMTVKKGCTAYLPEEQDDVSTYLLQDRAGGLFASKVETGSVKVCKPGTSVPDHTVEPVELLCFELLPYAAMLAGLMTPKEFFEGIFATREQSGSEDWAERLGGPLTDRPKVTSLKDLKLQRGDIVVLYDLGGAGIHTVIASGQTDGDGVALVYSLSEEPANIPGQWPITEVAATFRAVTVDHAKVVTPT